MSAIGSSIRALRRERGLSLRELSERTEFSIGFLSLVERGKSSLALTSLHKVARALGTDAGYFFATGDNGRGQPAPHVVYRSGEVELSTGTSRTYRLLGGRGFERLLEPMLVTIEPGDDLDQPFAHEGEEFAYVLQGELVYVIDGLEYRLGPGDSIHFPSTTPHSAHNRTSEPVEALWVLTPRMF